MSRMPALNDAVLKLSVPGQAGPPAADVTWFPWSRVAEVEHGYLPCGHGADGFFSWSAGPPRAGERTLSRAVEGQLRGRTASDPALP